VTAWPVRARSTQTRNKENIGFKSIFGGVWAICRVGAATWGGWWVAVIVNEQGKLYNMGPTVIILNYNLRQVEVTCFLPQTELH